jgi:DNA polymerase-1
MGIQTTPFGREWPNEPNKILVNTPERFETLVRFLTGRTLVVDYETSGVEWFKSAEAVGAGLASWDDQGRLWNAYVPFRHRTGEQQLDIQVIGPAIKRLLEDPRTLKVAHNIKFEDHFSRREGWRIQGPRYDTMVAARLYDENRAAYLDIRAEQDLQDPDARKWSTALDELIRDLAKANKLGVKAYKSRFGYSELPIAFTALYCGSDTDQTGRLFQHYERWGLSGRYSRIWPTEMRLTEILCSMEENGLPIDIGYLQGVKAQVQQAKASYEAQLQQALGGHMINPGSDDEVRNLLLNVIGLQWEKRTQTSEADFRRYQQAARRLQEGSISQEEFAPFANFYEREKKAVDREVLETFAEGNYVCQLLLKWRDAEKIATTYTDSILAMLDPRGYLHGDLKQVGTNTGRLSCEKPNYQNFPSDDDERARVFSGKKVEDGGIDPWSIRRAFPMRGPGWVRVFLDYSQIELRVLAFYSKDPVMVDAYLKGEDIHARTAKEVGAILGRECPRRVAKVVNFGLSYCLSEKGLSSQAKIPYEEAQAFLAAFFQRYRGVAGFREDLWAQARRQGNAWNNIFGRTRRLDDLRSHEFWRRKRAERQMIGSAIQGTAAELTKESLVRVDDWIKASGIPALVCNTVHDEIQIDCPRECLPLVVAEAKKRMEAFPEFQPIPIIVDADWSDQTWADKREFEVANG